MDLLSIILLVCIIAWCVYVIIGVKRKKPWSGCSGCDGDCSHCKKKH